MKMKTVISIFTLIGVLSPPMAVPRALTLQQEATKKHASTAAPQCETSGTKELTITCAYTPIGGSPAGADSRSSPRIILNRAVISFTPSNDGHMHVGLTFTNDSGRKISDQRSVYLAIDDEKGENHMRRSLPHVDFTKLEPGKPTTLQETLLAPAFSPGPYVISIWIPSTDSSSKFDPAHNFLLSSNGVPDPATGLNRIGTFSVAASGGRKSSGTPN